MKWPLVAISDFCQTGSGTTPSRKKSEYFNGDIPWVKSGELRETQICKTEEHVSELALRETSLKFAPKGAILVAMYGATVGRVGLLGIDACTNQAVCHIVPDENKAYPKYVYYAIRSKTNDLIRLGVGGAQPNISQQKIKSFTVPLPPLEEQKRIAAILDQADALRRLRQSAIDRLNTLGQSIFYEMFGDPATNPFGWELKTIDDIAESTQYGTSAKAGETGSTAILRMGNITYTGEIETSNLKYIDIADKDISKYTVKQGDILFNRTNSPELVGKTTVYDNPEPMAYAGYLVRLRTKDQAHPQFVSAFLNSKYGKAVLRGMCKSIVGMANINAKELVSIQIPVPPIDLQRHFAERLAHIKSIKDDYFVHLHHLNDNFLSFQQRAFRREL